MITIVFPRWNSDFWYLFVFEVSGLFLNCAMNSRGIQLSGGMGNEMSKLLGGNKYKYKNKYKCENVQIYKSKYKREGILIYKWTKKYENRQEYKFKHWLTGDSQKYIRITPLVDGETQWRCQELIDWVHLSSCVCRNWQCAELFGGL